MSERREHDPDRMTRGARRGFAVLAIAVLATGVASTGASIAYANSTGHRQDQQSRAQAATIRKLDATIRQLQVQQQAACGFASVVGTLPVADKPHPGKIGVTIIGDARDWYRSNGCRGSIPPGPGFAKWSAYFKLPPELRR